MRSTIKNVEGTRMELLDRKFDEYHGLSLVSITMNESERIVDFLNIARESGVYKRIAIVDGGSVDNTVRLASPLVNAIKIIPFDGHYGNQKNNVIRMSFYDWTLLLDPDEKLSDKLMDRLPSLIEQDEYDCYSFPRREFLNGKEDCKVYPDYQDRLFRTYCRYVKPIHHELVGFKNKKIIPTDSGMDIIHSKNLERHINRNSIYNLFEIHYKHEMGGPGAQLMDSFSKKYKSLCYLEEDDEQRDSAITTK